MNTETFVIEGFPSVKKNKPVVGVGLRYHNATIYEAMHYIGDPYYYSAIPLSAYARFHLYGTTMKPKETTYADAMRRPIIMMQATEFIIERS